MSSLRHEFFHFDVFIRYFLRRDQFIFLSEFISGDIKRINKKLVAQPEQPGGLELTLVHHVHFHAPTVILSLYVLPSVQLILEPHSSLGPGLSIQSELML